MWKGGWDDEGRVRVEDCEFAVCGEGVMRRGLDGWEGLREAWVWWVW